MKTKINQCKTHEEVNEYFQHYDMKLWRNKYGYAWGEMSEMWAYFRERQKLLDKCGDQLRKLKEE